jgi:hypothetical protein
VERTVFPAGNPVHRLSTTYKKTSLVILSCHGYVWTGPCGMERTWTAVKKRVSVPNKLFGASDPLKKEG